MFSRLPLVVLAFLAHHACTPATPAPAPLPSSTATPSPKPSDTSDVAPRRGDGDQRGSRSRADRVDDVQDDSDDRSEPDSERDSGVSDTRERAAYECMDV